MEPLPQWPRLFRCILGRNCPILHPQQPRRSQTCLELLLRAPRPHHRPLPIISPVCRASNRGHRSGEDGDKWCSEVGIPRCPHLRAVLHQVEELCDESGLRQHDFVLVSVRRRQTGPYSSTSPENPYLYIRLPLPAHWFLLEFNLHHQPQKSAQLQFPQINSWLWSEGDKDFLQIHLR